MSAKVSLELPSLVQCDEVADGGADSSFMVYPIRIGLKHKEKLTLYFISAQDRQSMVDHIMKVQGFASQLE